MPALATYICVQLAIVAGKTRSILAFPIRSDDGEVIGCIQMINKQNEEQRLSDLHKVSSSGYLQFFRVTPRLPFPRRLYLVPQTCPSLDMILERFRSDAHSHPKH